MEKKKIFNKDFTLVVIGQIISHLQLITPSVLIGKIMSLAMCVSMCATPFSQAIYGILFQNLADKSYILF